MNLNKVAKAESGYANRDRLLGSSANSKASTSKTGNSHNVNGLKKSSSNTKPSWNASCSKLLCSFGGSKSKVSDPGQVSLVKKKETRTHVTDSVPGLKIVKESLKNDSRPLNKSVSVSCHKVGNTCIIKKDIKSDKLKQSIPNLSGNKPPVPVLRNPTLTGNKPPVPVSKNPKDPLIHKQKSTVSVNQIPKHIPSSDLRKRVDKIQDSKDSSVATQKGKTHKTDGAKSSMATSSKKWVPKPVQLKDSHISTQKSEARRVEFQKKSLSKVSAAPVKKIGAKKTSTRVHDKDQPSSSRYQPQVDDDPLYHIRWDGDDMDPELSGQICMLCEKDLSCSPHEKAYESHEDDEYEDDEYEYDEYEFDIDFTPQLLPAVDILPCGHAFHSECSGQLILDEKSTDPHCVFCLSML